MKWGDIKLVKDPEEVEMLVWNTERGTKSITGEKAQAGQRKFSPMAVATGTDRFPVKLYKAFAGHRLDSMKLADSQDKGMGGEPNLVLSNSFGQKQDWKDINKGKICHWCRDFHRESL